MSKFLANKKNTTAKLLIASFVLLSFGVSFQFAFAASEDPTSSDFQLAPAKGSCETVNGVEECGWNDLIKLINRVVRFLVFFSAIIGTMAFCYAGFLYLTAFGESGKIEQAHSIFSSTITGIVIILIAWLVVATILKTLDVNTNFSMINFSEVETIQTE